MPTHSLGRVELANTLLLGLANLPNFAALGNLKDGLGDFFFGGFFFEGFDNLFGFGFLGCGVCSLVVVACGVGEGVLESCGFVRSEYVAELGGYSDLKKDFEGFVNFTGRSDFFACFEGFFFFLIFVVFGCSIVLDIGSGVVGYSASRRWKKENEEEVPGGLKYAA
jgi:hypothetical protein